MILLTALTKEIHFIKLERVIRKEIDNVQKIIK